MKQNQRSKGLISSIRTKFNKYINKLKFKIIEIMAIGKDMDEMSIYALEIAKREADEEFTRRFENEESKNKGLSSSYPSSKQDKELDFKFFLDRNRNEYNEMIKESYNRHLSEMKRMWYFKNLDKLIPKDDKNSHNAKES